MGEDVDKNRALVKLTIGSGIALGSLVIGSGLTGVGAIVITGLLANVAVGIATNAIEALTAGKDSDHGLTKAVGKAISRVIKTASEQYQDDTGKNLKKIAEYAEKNWVKIAQQELDNKRYPEVLKEGKLDQFLTPEEYQLTQNSNLTSQEWKDIFTRLNMAACQDGGFRIDAVVYEKVGNLLHSNFPNVLGQTLNEYFVSDSQAFAGLTLQLLINMKAEIENQGKQQTEEFAKILDRIKNLEPQLKGTDEQKERDQPAKPVIDLSIDYPNYIKRGIEKEVLEIIKKDTAFIRIKGLKYTGKTDFLHQFIIPQTKGIGYLTVSLDLSLAEKDDLTDIRKFVEWFCKEVSKQLQSYLELDKTDSVQQANQIQQMIENLKSLTCNQLIWSKQEATNYMEKVFKIIQIKPLLLSFINVDDVFQYRDVADDLAQLLHSWLKIPTSGGPNSNLWKQLRLVILHSTEKYAKLDINYSPLFSLGSAFELDEFNLAQVKQFLHKYGRQWSDSDIKKLVELVGGHPYLIQIASKEALNQPNTQIDDLLKQASRQGGIYYNLLLQHLDTLNKQPNLCEEFRKVIMSDVPIDLKSVVTFQLQSLGLIKLEGGKVTPRCKLYREYFKQELEIK